MKAQQVIQQLQAVLPLHTDVFSDVFSIDTISQTGTVITVTTTADHALETGDSVLLKGLVQLNSISGYTGTGTITATTAAEHDLTKGWIDSIDIVNLAGETETKTLITVPTRSTFTFSTAISLTGDTYLQEPTAWNYQREEITVTGPKVFTVDIASARIYVEQDDNSYLLLSSTPVAGGKVYISANMRVSGAVTPEAAAGAYTSHKAKELWAFAVLGTTRASRNQQMRSEGTAEYNKGIDYRQKIVQTVDVIIISTVSDEIASRESRDEMEDVRQALFRSLIGVRFDSGTNEGSNYGLTYVEDNVLNYQGSVFVHAFTFEYIFEVNYEDTAKQLFATAWNDFAIKYKKTDDVLIKEDEGQLP